MRISLRYKAALLIAATEALLLSLLLMSNLHNTRLELEEQLTTQAASTAELVASSATEPLLTLDLAQLNHLLHGVIDKTNVNYVNIRDHKGQILAEAGRRLTTQNFVNAKQSIYVADSLFGNVSLQVSREKTEASLAKTTRSNITIVMLEMILVALISLSLGWFLTRNLKELARGTEAIANGDYHAWVPAHTNDEVGDLSKSFNTMARQLQHHVEELDKSNRRFRDIADNTSDWLWESDLEGRYTYSSKQVESLLGYRPDQIVGTVAFDLMQPVDSQRLKAVFGEIKRKQTPFYGFEYHANHKQGGEVIFETNGTPIIDEHGDVVGYRGVTRDITRRKEDESRLLYLAEHDTLTGLVGRHKFIDLLEDEIGFSNRTGIPFNILLVDVDGFKLINDTHGHVAGDALLRAFADLVATQLDQDTVLARLGGDEFGILLRGSNAQQAEALAKRILDAIETTPFSAHGTGVRLFASIGICAHPGSGHTSEIMIAHADSAMSHAQSLGHNRFHVYNTSDTLMDSMRNQVNWQTLIHEALENDRLKLEYQPIVPLSGKTDDIPQFEALVRIFDKDRNVTISAKQFIEAAENTGQVSEIDKWVLRQVLATLKDVRFQDCVIAINVSARSLGTPGFCDYFQEQVFDSGVDSRNIRFELTESAAVAEMARAESFLSRMKKLGYKISLDDFGVGFSSFSYLKHLPVDQIKIDGSFIRHLDKNREDQIFVRSIIQVAHGLGLETVAEYVESQGALDILADMGVDYVQGYYLAKPGPVLEAAAKDWKKQRTAKRGKKAVSNNTQPGDNGPLQ